MVGVGHRGKLGAAAALVLTAYSRVAAADPVCDAGTICPDNDGDGFAACGCAWSGTPCDCDDSDPTVYPGAPESCDSTRDFNCDGKAPDSCPTEQACLRGTCVPLCRPLDDFGCKAGATFLKIDGGPCICDPADDCSLYGCRPGFACNDAKTCVPDCDPGVKCPFGQICRGSGCVDPCAAVTCPAGAVCRGGLCLPSCSCNPNADCPPGETCDLSAAVPSCVDPACVGVRCADGLHCERGACVDDCAGVVCPTLRVCRKVSVNGAPPSARCVDACEFNPCTSNFLCDWRTGKCIPRPRTEGGLAPVDDTFEALEVAGAGWLCSGGAAARASAAAALGLGAAALVLVARRRRRRQRE